MIVRRSISALQRRSPAVRIAALAAAFGAAYGVTVLVAASRQGTVGVAAASLAAGLCFGSAVAALLLSRRLSGPAYGMTGVLLPMATRTGLPLILALAVRLQGQGLVERGFVYYLVGFYLLALVIEIPMSLPPQEGLSKSTSEGLEVHG